MARKPVGVMVISLDLETAAYTKAQQKILTESKEAAATINANFQRLGVTSDQIYAAMASRAELAFRKIGLSSKASLAEVERSYAAMVTSINTANQQMAKNPLFETLGIRSHAAIEAQKKAVIDSFEAIKTIGFKSDQERIVAQRAMNNQLKTLNKEMVGDHEMSMASMTRAVLRWYAAIYVAQAALQFLSIPFIKGFKAVEEYNTAIASMAAMVVTFGQNMRGLSLEDQWKGALAYSTAMIPVLEKIAAKTLLSGQETIALANAFARSGVFLDANNAKQIDAFTKISNALPLMTQGQEITRQINTEVRSLMTGMNVQSSMMLITLREIDPEIEKHMAQWRATDTVLEHIGELLKGFGPATEILEKQWQAVKTSLDTTVNQILRGAMKQSYEDIIALTQELDKWLQTNKQSISDTVDQLRATAKMLKVIYDAAPSGTFEAASMGIIGKILWGNQVGLMIAAISLVNTKLKETGNNLGALPKKAFDAWDAIKNIGTRPGLGETIVPPIPMMPLTQQEKANLNVIKIMKMMDETINKNHKESIAEYDKQTKLQFAAFKEAGATEDFTNKYLEKRNVLKEQQFSLDKKAGDAAKKAADDAKHLKEAWDATALSLQQKIDTAPLDNFDKELKDLQYEIEKLRKQPYANKALIDTYQLAEETKIITRWQEDFNKRQVHAAEEYQRQEEAKAKSIIKGQEAVDRAVRDSAKEQERLQKEANARQVEMYKTVANAIHNSFATMFEDLFSGATNSFRKMGDSILSIFRRMLAQMATLAIARPIIVPIVSAMGSVLGVESATAGILKEMGISGAIASSGSSVGGSGGVVSNVGYGAAGAGFLGEISGILPSLQSTVTNSGALIAAHLAGEEAGAATGQAIANLSTEAFSAWTAGITTFISRLLQGQDFGRAAQSGLGAAGGAYVGAKGGAAIGSYFGPVGTAIGAFVGAIAGGFLGALGVDKLFSSGENEFTLTELVNKEINAQIFDKVNGFKQKNWDAGTVGNDWYIPIANAYAASIETIQQSFNTMVFDFTSKLPKEMQSQILNELASADFAATLTAASLGRYNESEAATVLSSVAKNYAEALAKSLGNAYANALGDYVSLKGGEGLIGDTAAWAVLTDRVQDNINKMFKDIGAQIKGGDTEGGLKAINDINLVIDKIGAAMAPITEIIATRGMTEYELSLRAINKQFDDYGKALEEAGIDLAKYTDLEKARAIELAKAHNQITQALLDQRTSITQWLSDMNRSALAPSNSMEAVQTEYSRLKGIASGSGATATDTSNFLNYAKEYLDYMKKYGGDYKAIYGGVMSDVGGLKAGIDLQLDIAQKQLDVLNLIATNTKLTATGIIGSSYLNSEGVNTIVSPGVVENNGKTTTINPDYVQSLKDIIDGKTPGWTSDDAIQSARNVLLSFGIKYATGGYANSPSIFGEAGGEWAVPTYEPQRKNFLKSAPKAFWDNLGLNGGSNGPGGDMIVHVHVEVDGKEIGQVVTKQIPRNGDLAGAIRRAAN